MLNLGYSNFTNDVLMKSFDDIIININMTDNVINSIIGYDSDQELVDVPEEIIDLVNKDIDSSK